MRLSEFAAAVGSAVALVGFAGAANASATIDLIWADTGTNQISNVFTSSAITLQVILTAGPLGSRGAGVSVDYSAALGKLTVLGYASTPGGALPFPFGETIDTGSRIENINSGALFPFVGSGLLEGQSHQLGTVTFHKSLLLNGTFEIRSDANGPTDAVLDLDGNVITDMTTFNSAFLCNTAGLCPTPTPTATPTATPPPPGSCAAIWRVSKIVTIGKGQSPTNNPKVSHVIFGNIVDPDSLGSTAHRIPVCAGTQVSIVVSDSTGTPTVTAGGSLSCDFARPLSTRCTGVVNVTEKYKSVSSDGKDTDRMTLLPK